MTIRHLYPAVEPSLNLDFANSRKLDSRITFTRGSTATYTDESGIIRTAAANEARFDHDTDGNSLGLLIEESRTNYVTTSEDLTGWSNATLGDGVNPTVQNVSATAPNNGSTVTEITLERGTASTSNYSIYRKQFGTTAVSTGSMYFKAARPQDVGKVIDFYHNQGTPIDFASVTLTNAWQRVSSVGVGGAVGYLSIALYNSTASTGEVKVLAWGAQVEEGSFPTSYIPTAGSTVTRSVDVASMTGTNFSSWYNQSEGTTYSETRNVPFGGGLWYYGPGGAPRWWSRNELGNGVRTQAYDGSGASGVVDIVVSGSGVGNIIPSLKHIVTIDNVAQEHAGSANGSSVITGSWDSISGVSALQLGKRSDLGGNNGYLNGHISRLTYYPTRLPDATLQALTL